MATKKSKINLSRFLKSSGMKMTPEQYEAYREAPIWILDGFDSKEAYEQYWCQTISSWHTNSKRYWERKHGVWKKIYETLDITPNNSANVMDPDSWITNQPIDILKACILELIGICFSNMPRFTYSSIQPDGEKFANLLNQLSTYELEKNSFDNIIYEVAYDLFIADIGIIKISVDFNKKNLFGEYGDIVLQRINPLHLFFDPESNSTDWEFMKYIIYSDKWDLSTVRKKFPDSPDIHSTQGSWNTSRKTGQELYGDYLLSPLPNLGDNTASDREFVDITECWFKDTRQKFIADIGTGGDDTYEVDDEGFVKGHWIDAYEHGRCIVIGNEKRVLLDIINPYWHDSHPFVFLQGNPSSSVVGLGEAVSIKIVESKMNNILMKIENQASAEINRPILCDSQAFHSPDDIHNLQNNPNSIVVTNPGKTLQRMEGTEIPQYVFQLYEIFSQLLERMKGISGISRGELAEGSQLAAGAVNQLQNMAASRLKMKLTRINKGLKDLGNKMQWLIRETYNSNLQGKVMMADGNQELVVWNSGDFNSQFLVNIQPGTGLPGAENSARQVAMDLYERGIVDAQYVLEQYKFPQSEIMNIMNRMKQKELTDIQAESAGKALGVSLKKAEKLAEGRIDKAKGVI
ncbi:MAG: hypothetical protein QXL94_00845 [Candidatus Parvarchaeum sp.]